MGEGGTTNEWHLTKEKGRKKRYAANSLRTFIPAMRGFGEVEVKVEVHTMTAIAGELTGGKDSESYFVLFLKKLRGVLVLVFW